MNPSLKHLCKPMFKPLLKYLCATPAANALVVLTLTLSLTLSLTLALPATAHAGPGAHGPNGEHLDAPGAVRTVTSLPRLQTHTEAFELVAELRATELAILVDRYDSNEPVLGARLEVESGAAKAVATFRPEQGDYAVTDAALLKALNAPGEHALVFTLVAGNTSDLLDGKLASNARKPDAAGLGPQAPGPAGHAHAHADGHDHGLERAAWVGAGIVALSLLGGIAWWRQRRQPAQLQQGGL